MDSDTTRSVLFLAANPRATNRLRLDEEAKRIEQAIERSKGRSNFKLVQKWAVTDDDLRRSLLDNSPEIVHFSGHGAGQDGLFFEADDGSAQQIYSNSLAELFRLCAGNVKCVLLNACMSDVQARAISKHVDYVIGMQQEIGDMAAIKFSIGFYDALCAGRNYEHAYRFGCNAIDLRSIPERLTPVLLDRLSPRHFVPDDISVKKPNDYISITLQDRSSSKPIFLKPEAFQSIGAILDELFVHYLSDRVAPFSYGSEWMLISGHFNERIAVPIEWLNSTLPVHSISSEWLTQMPDQIGMVPNSTWEIVLLKSEGSNNLQQEAIGIVTNSEQMATALLEKPKLYAFLADSKYLVAQDSAESKLSLFRHKVVFRDWLGVRKSMGQILIDTGNPLTPYLKNLMENM